MKFLKELLFLMLTLRKAKPFLSETEWKIVINMAKTTYVRNCLIVPEKPLGTKTNVRMLKSLSEENILTVFLQQEYLRKHLENIDMGIFRWTAIILKERSLNSVDYFNNKSLVSSYFWIIFDSSNGTLRYELQRIIIPFDCALLLIEKVNDDQYLLYEYYKIKKSTPGVLNKYAEWKNNSMEIPEVNWFDRKSNMKKYEFTSVKFNQELYLTPKDKVNEEIWKELSILLNFTISNKVVNYSLENGHMDLQSEEEEEALLDTQIYLGRSGNYTYLLGPTSETKLYMHVKVLGEDTSFYRFLKPFEKLTWLCIGAWMLLCGFVVFIIEYLSGRLKLNAKQQNESRFTFFIPLYFLSNQNGAEINQHLSSRLALLVIRLSAAVTCYAYLANFLTYILLFIPKLPFTDIKGFIEDGTYKMEGERNSDVDTYFKVSSDPFEKIVYEKFLTDITTWSRFDKGVDKMCAGEKLVLVGYDNDIEKYMPCNNIVKINKPLQVFANGFKIRFRSPFRGILHIKLLLMRNTGILQRVNKKIIYNNLKTLQKKETYDTNIEKVFPIFYILATGCFLSILIFLFEIIIWKSKNYNMKPL